MFRFVLAFFVVSTCSQSLGVPLPATNTTNLNNALVVLAKTCENPFISAQITAKLNECNVSIPPYNEKQVECLIFYDINRQLCEAVGASILAVTDEQGAKLEEAGNVENLCVLAKSWKLSNLTEFPRYKTVAETAFSNPVVCLKVCAVEDVMSLDANFFCKYYKWGADMLNLHLTPAPEKSVHETNVSEAASSASGIVPSLISSAANQSVTINQESSQPVVLPNEVRFTQNTSQLENPVKFEESNITNTVQQSSNQQASGKEVKLEKNSDTETQNIPVQSPTDLTVNSGQPTDNIEMPPVNADNTIKGDDKLNPSNVMLPLNSDNNGSQIGDNMDYQDQDSEEIGDSLPNNPVDEVKGELDIKPEQKETKNARGETVSSFTGEKELFPDTFSDDDDHFFPFFLTAVVLVVLIYVLYHNKNKVTKVVLGLIVEGRQPGRRRNSRGHSYRRLDTLEQAMSANTAAPPSKIIY